jgi:ATP-dependent helicase/DNAse subunit B
VAAASCHALWEQINRGGFKVAMMEGDVRTKAETRDGSVTVSGRVDRVDIYRDDDGSEYVKIIDYKSGKARFNPEEVRTGTRLQLPLYLAAMLNHPDIPRAMPGGFHFFPIDDPLVNTDIALPPEVRDAALIKAFKPSGIEPDEALLEQAKEITRKLATKLTDGLIPATPCATGGKLPCEYCAYTAVCGVS